MLDVRGGTASHAAQHTAKRIALVPNVFRWRPLRNEAVQRPKRGHASASDGRNPQHTARNALGLCNALSRRRGRYPCGGKLRQ